MPTVMDNELHRLARRQSELQARRQDIRSGPADPSTLADIQADWDPTYRSVGAAAPPPRASESPGTYARRLASELAPISKRWARADLYAAPDDLLQEAAADIRAAVQAKIADPRQGDFQDPSKLRRVERVDDFTGQKTISWHGDPRVFINSFAPAEQFVTRLGHSRNVKIWAD